MLFLFNFYIYLFIKIFFIEFKKLKWIQCLSLLPCLKMHVEQRVCDFRSRFYWGVLFLSLFLISYLFFYANPFARSPEYVKINFCLRLMMIVRVFQYLFPVI